MPFRLIHPGGEYRGYKLYSVHCVTVYTVILCISWIFLTNLSSGLIGQDDYCLLFLGNTLGRTQSKKKFVTSDLFQESDPNESIQNQKMMDGWIYLFSNNWITIEWRIFFLYLGMFNSTSFLKSRLWLPFFFLHLKFHFWLL